jgi:predicted metal-dependent hydrolase
MPTQLILGDIVADVLLKDIKNVHLSVYPPSGHVRISAPEGMSLENIRAYAVSKIGWIRQQQSKLREQERTTPREYVDGESHYIWGKRYRLKVLESNDEVGVSIRGSILELRIRPGTNISRREELYESWLRAQLKPVIVQLIEKWEPKLGVSLEAFHVRRMKTKWGSCSPSRRAIRLNTELAKKPIECLEYIVVHEMVHLLEPSHNQRFHRLMNEHFPKWQFYRDELNRLPVRHEDWRY